MVAFWQYRETLRFIDVQKIQCAMMHYHKKPTSLYAWKVLVWRCDFWLQPKTKQNCGKLFQIDVNFARHITREHNVYVWKEPLPTNLCLCPHNQMRTWKCTTCGAQHISNANMKMRSTKSCLATAPPLWSWTSSIHSKQRRWWWWGESLAENEWPTIYALLCKSCAKPIVMCTSVNPAIQPPPLPPSSGSDCESASGCLESRELQCS